MKPSDFTHDISEIVEEKQSNRSENFMGFNNPDTDDNE